MPDWRRLLENALLCAGAAALLVSCSATVQRHVLAAIDRAALRSASPAVDSPPEAAAWVSPVALRATGDEGAAPRRVDTSEWSLSRVTAYLSSLGEAGPPRLALLEIPRIRLQVAVLEGTDGSVLDRGVGHISETPPPGAAGNVGIAGHRDGFFRGLRHLRPGDAIHLTTRGGETRVYEVEWTRVVAPENVAVLGSTSRPSLTLVTCFPFWYVGSAPERFIVRAEAREPGSTKES